MVDRWGTRVSLAVLHVWWSTSATFDARVRNLSHPTGSFLAPSGRRRTRQLHAALGGDLGMVSAKEEGLAKDGETPARRWVHMRPLWWHGLRCYGWRLRLRNHGAPWVVMEACPWSGIHLPENPGASAGRACNNHANTEEGPPPQPPEKKVEALQFRKPGALILRARHLPNQSGGSICSGCRNTVAERLHDGGKMGMLMAPVLCATLARCRRPGLRYLIKARMARCGMRERGMHSWRCDAVAHRNRVTQSTTIAVACSSVW